MNLGLYIFYLAIISCVPVTYVTVLKTNLGYSGKQKDIGHRTILGRIEDNKVGNDRIGSEL